MKVKLISTFYKIEDKQPKISYLMAVKLQLILQVFLGTNFQFIKHLIINKIMFSNQEPELVHPLPPQQLQQNQSEGEAADKSAQRRFESMNLQKNVSNKLSMHLKKQHSKYLHYFDKFFKHSSFTKTNKNQQTPSSASGEATTKPFVFTLRQLPRKVHSLSNVTVMLKTQYPIITTLAHRYFNFKFYNKEDHFDDNFLIWIDTYVTEEFVKRLKSYQKINHFPNSCELGRKDLLSLNLKLAQNLMPDEYTFYPKTWILPNQYDTFYCQRSKDKFYIVKPHANCQGRGIYISKNPGVSRKDEVIIQEYIQRPMLIEGNKFDLRIYVLLRSLSPLRIYIYKEGLCRLATSKYKAPDEKNIENEKMHLTNYAINKHAPSFIPNRDIARQGEGHKRSYTSVLRQLQRRGLNAQEIEDRIQSVIVRTIMATYTKMLHSYKKSRQQNVRYKHNIETKPAKEQAFTKIDDFNPEEPSVCFQLLGFDIMLLQTGEPILIEINHQPSLVTDSPFDLTIKKCLLMDTINLLSIDEKDKEYWQKCQTDGTVYRNPNLDQKQLQNMGGFKKIYPISHTEQPNLFKALSEQQQKNEAKKIVYETILNSFLFNEYKRMHRIKMSNYKTISYRPATNHISQKKIVEPSIDNEKISTSSDKRRNIQQKAIALTFYNLFNDPKFHIKRNSFKLTRPLNTSDDDLLIKTHENQQGNPDAPKSSILKMKASMERKLKQRQQQQRISTISGEKGSSNLEKIYLKRISLYGQDHRASRQAHLQIKNRGIMHYVNPDGKKNKHNVKMLNQIIDKINSEDHIQPAPTKYVTKKGQTHSFSIEQSNVEPKASQLDTQSRTEYYKEKYGASIREKLQRINNIKTIKSEIKKYNFNNFLHYSSSKYAPYQTKIKLALSLQKTHPSQG